MDRRLLVTGTDMGLGYAITEEALIQGYTVYSCLYKKALDNMLNLKSRFNEKLILVEGVDIGDDKSVESAVEAVLKSTDFLDVIINNGAINPDNFKSKLEEIDFDVALNVFNVNTLGALRIAKGFIGLLRRGYLKTIINVSSEAGSITQSYRVTGYDYCMSKAAMNMMSSMLQTYLKPEGIKILSVYPGWMQTEMGGKGAILNPAFAAQKVLKLVMVYQGKFNSYIFVDNDGNPIDW